MEITHSFRSNEYMISKCIMKSSVRVGGNAAVASCECVGWTVMCGVWVGVRYLRRKVQYRAQREGARVEVCTRSAAAGQRALWHISCSLAPASRTPPPECPHTAHIHGYGGK